MNRCGMAGLSAGALLLLAWCNVFNRDEVYRFRVTVEVQTPQGTRTGSSVWQVLPHVEARPMAGSGVQLAFRGEAVAVDLPNGQTLFALLTGADGDSDYASRMPGNALFSPLVSDPPGTRPSGFRRQGELYPRAIRTEKFLNRSPLPLLVRFRSIDNPMTVEKVDPENIAASFGAGYLLKQIAVEPTDDPVTTGLERQLTWLPRLHGDYLNGRTTSAGAPLGLYGGNFSANLYR